MTKILIVGMAVLCLSVGVLGFKPLLLEENCGFENQISARIMNGQAAKLGENPWMAYLKTPSGSKCAGTLINHWFVLTTAQCIPDDLAITVRLGEYNTKTKHDCENRRCQGDAEEYEVDMAFRHTKYKPSEHLNDIGLLRLERRVEYFAHIRPICIFVDERLRDHVNLLTWFTTVGWGKTADNKSSNILQKIDISRQPKELCSEIFGHSLTSDQICAGNQNGALCTGDLGGPQMRLMWHNNHDRYVQLGIASWVSDKCLNGSIFTNLLPHGHWIERVVRQFGPVQDLQRPSATIPDLPDFYQPI
ncbi:melanization protease 1 [Drosophila takahashii]|uniref:melanization protease 1 n=1 Tax=Drosophila takahashii TaxID=29030 RepID=UPI001CF82AA1|nr:melanization protease 1 [Drosophila takahashii]